MVYETRKEPVQVQYYEQEAVTRTVLRPVTKQTYVPYTETISVPRQVVQRVPLSYYDPFSPAIVNTDYSSFSSPISSSIISSKPIISSPIVSQPIESTGESILSPPGSFSSTPETKVQKVEFGEPESAASVDDLDVDPDDADELPAPELNQPENETKESEESTDAKNAGWRIRWNPVFAREA
jgi:hypothetical protein